MKSFILTEEVAERAISMVLASFDRLAESPDLPASRAMAIVVLDPTRPFAPNQRFVDAILQVVRFNEGQWELPYDEFAKGKANISWRTGLPSHLVQQRAPYLYESGDVKYGGSVVWEGGLIVAASGVEWYFDQMIANWVAAACQALSIRKMEQILADPGDRVGL